MIHANKTELGLPLLFSALCRVAQGGYLWTGCLLFANQPILFFQNNIIVASYSMKFLTYLGVMTDNAQVGRIVS